MGKVLLILACTAIAGCGYPTAEDGTTIDEVNRKSDETTCNHVPYFHDKDDVETLPEEKIGKRLWVEIQHGPSRTSGWIYAVGYPSFYLTNGENTAEMALNDLSKRKCFCKGEWWIKTNGWGNVSRQVTRIRWRCSCGRETQYEYRTNFLHAAESEVK